MKNWWDKASLLVILLWSSLLNTESQKQKLQISLSFQTSSNLELKIFCQLSRRDKNHWSICPVHKKIQRISNISKISQKLVYCMGFFPHFLHPPRTITFKSKVIFLLAKLHKKLKKVVSCCTFYGTINLIHSQILNPALRISQNFSFLFCLAPSSENQWVSRFRTFQIFTKL